jgi:hypothetical protein
MASKSSNSAPLGIRKVERPRPLRCISHTGIPSSSLTNASSNSQQRNSFQDIPMEEIVKLLELIPQQLDMKNYNETCVKAIIRLNSALKQHGSQLEHLHRNLLDKAQISLRNACKDTNLSITARLHILEIIELRSMKWAQSESTRSFYAQKISSMLPKSDETDSSKQLQLNVNAPTFQPSTNIPTSNGGNILNQLLPRRNVSVVPSGEVMVGSGKYSGPTQPHGKSYYKDEIYIRNADSGKVAPGSLDRLVQITGSASENVAQAKNLVHDTIRRNQSPLPDTFGDHNEDGGRGGGTGNRQNPQRQFSLESFSSQKNEFKFSVKVANEGIVMLSSSNLDLVKSAKIALEEHFSGRIKNVHPLGVVPPPAGHRVDILRIPIYPNSNVAQIHEAEAEEALRSKERRAKFAKTAANRKLNEAAKTEEGSQKSKIYDRDFLLSFTSKAASIKMPEDLEKLLKELDLGRKVTETKTGTGNDFVAPNHGSQRVFDPSTGIWTDAVTYINEHSRA